MRLVQIVCVLRLFDERDVRLVEQAYGFGVEGTGLVEGFKHAEPHLIRRFGTDYCVRATIVGEVETRSGCVTVQGWVFHRPIVSDDSRQTFDERGMSVTSLRTSAFGLACSAENG